MILSNPVKVDPRVQNEARALMEDGHSIKIIVWDRKQEYSQRESLDGIDIIRIHNRRIMRYLPNDLLRNYFFYFNI